MAGNVVYEVQKFIRENNFKSQVILFIHDSIEIDIHPAEIIPIGSKIIPLMNKYPMDEFQVPTAADLVIGRSLGQEITVESITDFDENGVATMELTGYLDDYEDLINNLELYYDDLEEEIVKPDKDEYVSNNLLFTVKASINSHMGTIRKKVDRLVKLRKKSGDPYIY